MRHTRKIQIVRARRAAWALMAGLLVAGSFCAFGQQTASVDIALGAGYTSAGNTIEIPVTLTATGDKRPTSISLFIAYTAEFVAPAENFYETNVLDEDYGLPVIDADGNTETTVGPVRLEGNLTQLGKVTDIRVHPSGVIDITITGAPDQPFEDGLLCTLAFRALPKVSIANVAYLHGISSDAPVELEGDMVGSWAAKGLEATLDVSFSGADGQIGFLECSTKPKAPKGVQVTNDFPNGVRVTWDPVDVTDIEYRVFRSASGLLRDAVAVGSAWQVGTSFVDITAKAAVVDATAGCFLKPNATVTPYHYWVKARAVGGCESAYSRRSVAGERSGYSASPRAGKVAVEVFPGRSEGGPALLTELLSPLAIRLSAATNIDPLSVWGQISSQSVNGTAVEWVPALSHTATNNRAHSGWVVFRPSTPWAVGETITMTVGAKTLSGREITPVTREFQRAPDSAGTGGTGGAVKLVALGLDAVPPLAPGLGTPYLLSPNEVYGQLEKVWLTLPADRKASEVELYYFSEAEGDGRWVLGDSVEGWLGTNTVEKRTVGNIQYLGYWVRHGGVIQLGLKPGRVAEKPAPADVSGGDSGSLALSILTLLVLAAGYGRTRRAGCAHS